MIEGILNICVMIASGSGGSTALIINSISPLIELTTPRKGPYFKGDFIMVLIFLVLFTLLIYPWDYEG